MRDPGKVMYMVIVVDRSAVDRMRMIKTEYAVQTPWRGRRSLQGKKTRESL